MGKTPAKMIWEFFAEYYDDSITMPGGGPVVVTAQTMRAVGAMFGRVLLREMVDAWTKESLVRVVGDWDSLDGNAPCIELLDYVSEKEIDSPLS